MKTKLITLFFLLSLSLGVVAHETEHFDNPKEFHASDCSLCLAEQSEALIIDFLVDEDLHEKVYVLSFEAKQAASTPNYFSIRAPPQN